MTPKEMASWVAFRFTEWAILRERDRSTISFEDYFASCEAGTLEGWAHGYWERITHGTN